MFQPGDLEAIARERRYDREREINQADLVQRLEEQEGQPSQWGISQEITERVGSQMIKWGLKLQGRNIVRVAAK
jgi:hypothetical protein